VLNHLPENMEISKNLQEEILDVQQELQKAIFEHQVRERKRERERERERKGLFVLLEIILKIFALKMR